MPNKRRILFVDDEANLLAGLRRMLRSMRCVWDMRFAQCGPDALDMLAESPFDIIVTDMRMPGMDGAELLHQVMARYPQIIRIVLSGQADRESILGALGPIHQYLSKPCDADNLKATLQRACSLHSLLSSAQLRHIASNTEALPSRPDLIEALQHELQSPDASVERVAQIVSKDMGMSAKILQLVNSAFLGTSAHISGPAQAVRLLGLDTLNLLAFSGDVFVKFNPAIAPSPVLEALWEHSDTVAGYAGAIAQAEDLPERAVDYARMAGLLHDVGKLALATHVSADYAALLSSANGSAAGSLVSLEQQTYQATHAHLGGYLLGIWGLPTPVVEAVFSHHALESSSDAPMTPALAVFAANVLTNAHCQTPEFSAETCAARHFVDDTAWVYRLSMWREACLSTCSGRDEMMVSAVIEKELR